MTKKKLKNQFTRKIYLHKLFDSFKNRLLQAILFINDMFMLARNNTGSIFVEDVGEFLTANNIRATANVAFYGNSGMTLNVVV